MLCGVVGRDAGDERPKLRDELRASPHRPEAGIASGGVGLEVGVRSEQIHPRNGGWAKAIGPVRLASRPVDQHQVNVVRQVYLGVDPA